MEKQRSMAIKFPEMDNFYRYERERPLGEQLVLDVMAEGAAGAGSSEVKRLSSQCAAIKDCAGLKNSNIKIRKDVQFIMSLHTSDGYGCIISYYLSTNHS